MLFLFENEGRRGEFGSNRAFLVEMAAQRPGEAEDIDVLHQVDGRRLVEDAVEEPRELHHRVHAHLRPVDEAAQGRADLVALSSYLLAHCSSQAIENAFKCIKMP